MAIIRGIRHGVRVLAFIAAPGHNGSRTSVRYTCGEGLSVCEESTRLGFELSTDLGKFGHGLFTDVGQRTFTKPFREQGVKRTRRST